MENFGNYATVPETAICGPTREGNVEISRVRVYGLVLLVTLLAATKPSAADEGMWTLDNPPAKQLEEKYKFTPNAQWLDHIRLASVRFNDGGSGSFVSPNGLVITNHHVAFGQLQKVSTPEKDYVKDGFHAKTQAEELKCPDLELNVLVSMENVTSRVQGAVKPGMTEKQALDARKAEQAKIQKESLDKTGFRSDVVSLYQGGEYWLYRYKKYTDVRLVFAPEQQMAFFGGDPDNFTFPRHDLDFAIFRVYENDQPLRSTQYLKWNAKGAADQEPVFVTGHPGSTDRNDTVAELATERDVVYPASLKVVKRRIDTLRRYSSRGPEQARQAASRIFSLENAQKAFTGEYSGLLDPKIFAKKAADERALRDQINRKPELKAMYGTAWDDMQRAQDARRRQYKTERYGQLRGSSLAPLGPLIVQYAAEVTKPDSARL